MKKVIIVGAGILGASTAYHLAKSGIEVLIIDRFDSGQATDAAAGIVCPWITQRRNQAWYQLVKNGARYYPSLIEELKELGETETGYKQVGALSLHIDKTKLEKTAERAIQRRQDAPEIGDVTIRTPEETKKLFPPLAEGYGSVHVSGGARVNGRALRNSLLRAAQKHGATFHQGDATLIHSESVVRGVNLSGEEMRADTVVVTGGAWAKDLLEPLGVKFLVTPQKAQIIHLELANEDTGIWPVIMPPNNQYMLAFDKGRIVIGATHEDEAGFDQRVTAGGVHEILSKALEIAPGLAEATMIETRVGFRPFTPDFLPVIGALPKFEGIVLANGLGASGLTSGPYLGAELAKLAVGSETELDLTNYSVEGAIK
ncbi:NAD(P)/FAD-dependent oxidoreductase [Bacillus alkalicellulosilyticus]|uniref:NAD(P)/FAD-dependent oxidoreductase n=1 Tax=Alkalihalobacterium alkalicellulosilyticum TaxID=1912214 RepID=UPI000996CD33|nr:FAD-dependent oxidoreductase [Bacillus alkalicellulosilyticus]